MTDQIKAVRTFTQADQQRFARASRDTNPMHMDAVAARRTQASAPVVHGIHALIWVLDELAGAGLPVDTLTAVKVEFAKFVYLDRAIEMRVGTRSATLAKVELRDDGLLLSSLTLRFGTRKPASGEAQALSGVADKPVGAAPDEPTLDEMAKLKGWLVPPAGAAELIACYPHLEKAIGAERIAALAQTSTLVGMVCPGRHSIYSSLALTLADDLPARAGIGFETTDADGRFNMVTMGIGGSGLTGEVTAFVRQPPLPPPTLGQLRERLQAGEFAGVDALIVGGSRGLGAVTASLIASGGGRVTITYMHGRTEAETLCRQINAEYGADTARMLQLDVNAAYEGQLAALDGGTNQLYYFATPQIFRQQSALFSGRSFADFNRVYVDRFADICLYLSETVTSPEVAVFYPSSVAVTERPRGMTEYAMSKAAGEALCVDLDSFMPKIRVQWFRIPRTATDQTATVAAVAAEDPVDVMLPLVRSLTALKG